MPWRTKVAIYKSVIAARLYHGCETWILSEHTAAKFDSFQQRCLRACLGYKAIMKDGHPYYPTAVSVLERTGVERLSETIRERQRRAGIALRTLRISPTVTSWSTAREPHARRNNQRLLADVLQQRMTLTRSRKTTVSSAEGLAEVRLADHNNTVDCPEVFTLGNTNDPVAPTGFGGT
jgi:hypothetical protein